MTTTDEKLNEILMRFDKLDKKLDLQNIELTKMIDKKVKLCINETAKLNVRVNQLDQRMNNATDYEKRRYSLIVNGIPAEENEDINSIYAMISSKLGYPNPPEAVVYRSKGTDNNKRSIFIKFPTEFHKLQFFERHLKVAKDLKLECLNGFEGKKERFYIHHNLTKAQYEINKIAQQLRKDGKLDRVKVLNGDVAIKFLNETKFNFFASTKELEDRIKPPTVNASTSNSSNAKPLNNPQPR